MEATQFYELKGMFETQDNLRKIQAFLTENPEGVCIFRGIKTADDNSAEMTEAAMPDSLRTRFAAAVVEALVEAEAAITEVTVSNSQTA